MPLTPIQALDAVKENGFVVERMDDGGWRAQTRERTRLHLRTRPTYEEAVEAALLTLEESEKVKARADKSRLFDLLGTGKVRFEYREETVVAPGEPGNGGRVPRFDIYDQQQRRIVTGNASLHGAVVEADELGAFK